MNESEKITLIKATSDATDDGVISAFLLKAKHAILRRMYAAWHEWPEGAEVPTQYDVLQCELAIRYYNRQGAEGESAHGENGISRSYGSVDDADLLRSVTPICEVPM